MLQNRSDIGFKLSLLFKGILVCRVLAQDLNIIMATSVLVGPVDGDYEISGLICLKRGVD